MTIATLNTINYSRPKWAKSIPVFTPKWCKNHTLWDGTYLYGLYKRVSLWCYSSFIYVCKLIGDSQSNKSQGLAAQRTTRPKLNAAQVNKESQGIGIVLFQYTQECILSSISQPKLFYNIVHFYAQDPLSG